MISNEFSARLCAFIEKTIKYVDFILIRFFADRKFELLPLEWVDEHLDLQSILNEKDVGCSNNSLTSLLLEARTFKFDDFNNSLHAHLDASGSRDTRINLNKHRQLLYFGRFLIDLCIEHQVERIFDVGCGLGHLLGWLSENSDLELVGLDYNQIFCDRGKDLYKNVAFHSVDITDREAFTDLLYSKQKRSALISLHGCGDVQKILIQEFVALSPVHVPLLLTIGCCYHKMNRTDNNQWLMSEMFRSNLKVNIEKHILRLASEYRPANHVESSQEKRQHRVFSFISRGILEVFYERLGIQPFENRSKRRKLGNSLDEVKAELIKRFNVEGEIKEQWRNTFDQIVEEFKQYFPLVDVFLNLEFFLQEVYEALILFDRLAFIQENDIEAELKPVFDVRASPRNMCIVAKR